MSRVDGKQILSKYPDISYADYHNRIKGVLDWEHEWRSTTTGWKHVPTYASEDVHAVVEQIRTERGNS